jgi:hypothetical protein
LTKQCNIKHSGENKVDTAQGDTAFSQNKKIQQKAIL